MISQFQCLEPCLFIIDRSCLTPWYLFILTCFPSCIYLPILPHSLLFALVFNFSLSSDLHLYLQPLPYNSITKKPLQLNCLSSCLSNCSPSTLSHQVYCLASTAPHLYWATSSQCKCHQCYSCHLPSYLLWQAGILVRVIWTGWVEWTTVAVKPGWIIWLKV